MACETSATQRSMSSSSKSASSSATTSSTEAIKHDLGEIKSSMAEMKNMLSNARGSSQITTSSSSTSTSSKVTSSESSSSSYVKKLSMGNSSSNLLEHQKRLRASMDSLDEPMTEYHVTHPDSDGEMNNMIVKKPDGTMQNGHMAMNGAAVDTVKFEQKKTTSESKTKVVKDGFSSEQATINSAQMKKLHAGDVQYQEEAALAAMRNQVEVDGLKHEEKAAMLKEARSLKMGDFQQAEANNIAAHSVKVSSDHFSSEKKAIAQAQQRQTVTSTGVFNQEKHVSAATQSNYSSRSMVTSTSQMTSHSSTMNGTINGSFPNFEDLECLANNPVNIENVINKYSNHLTDYVKNLQQQEKMQMAPSLLNEMNEIIQRAWAVPTHGHELGASLCDTLRNTGGLDLLMKNCIDSDKEVQFSSAKLLEQCLTTENRSHVVKNGLDKVVNVACVCTKNSGTDQSRVGTGILQHLFKHSEDTCSNVIRLGGLDAVLFECRKNDVETLRHCAGALANLSLYGGAENQEAMINRKVPSWLFPLAFHHDENIKYYACLAIVVLVANKEIEAEVIKSGTLNLVEPFVTTHNPSEFAKSNLAHAHGQSKHWLQKLVPVLSSKREEARNLAAFHFCMEAGIKKEQGNTNIFKEIGAIEPLIRVASSPNAIASKFAAQALRLIGEEVPHKLSQQVPLWSTEDVREWVKQIGFSEYEHNFFDSKVDGDLLLQLTEDNLREDIGMTNGIRRKRFERELQNLKRMADYSSRDSDNLHSFLYKIAPEYTIYTYSMLNAGVDIESIKILDDDLLLCACGITNSIHRSRILNAIKNSEISSLSLEKSAEKNLDVFVSYRRSNGSQLASLLKVHLELRGFSVFIDVERLEAGKFDNNLLQSIRHAKHFLLVLTQDALERCVDDLEGKDWVHREIVAALNSDCNIIPIIDNFDWPDQERLPEDMRGVCHFNGVRWIHDYQDACVDKLERFMRAETNTRCSSTDHFRNLLNRPAGDSTPTTPTIYQRMHSNDSVGSSGLSQSQQPGSGSNSSLNQSRYFSSLAANRYRKSSSPARQLLGGVGSYATTGRTSRFPSSKLSALGGGIARNIRASEMRRSSAAGLNAASQRPPLPPKIENRCHSYEGLLREDKKPSEGEDRTDSKLPDTASADSTPEPAKPTEESIKTKNRRSRSMDDLFDDDRDLRDFLDNTQSMENLVSEETPTEPQSPLKIVGNICFNPRFVEPVSPETPETPDPRIDTASPESCGEQPCENETITVDSTPRVKKHDIEEDKAPPEDDVLSTNSSLNSFASTSDTTSVSKKSNTPFINKYVKKVKSLMKK